MIISDTFTNLIATNDYYKAQDVSQNVSEYLQYKLNKVLPSPVGYNMKVYCEFNDGVLDEDNASPSVDVCKNEYTSFVAYKVGNVTKNIAKSVVIDAEIKGRPEEGEKFTMPCLSGAFSSGCYTVPIAGDGTAGKDCMLYQPDLNVTSVDAELLNACNWNKLQFGSSSADRVVIPLYYTDDNDNIVEWTKDSDLMHFVLRLRNPCKKEFADEFLNCDDSERYVLDLGVNGSVFEDNNVVATWQIVGENNGLLGKGEFLNYGSNGISNTNTAIYEEMINSYNDNNIYKFSINDRKNLFKKTIETNSYNVSDNLNTSLKTIDKPVLILYLSDKLFESNDTKAIVPYLEYQLVTPNPTSKPDTELNVVVSVNGNRFEKSLKITREMGLIDFAIQN